MCCAAAAVGGGRGVLEVGGAEPLLVPLVLHIRGTAETLAEALVRFLHGEL